MMVRSITFTFHQAMFSFLTHPHLTSLHSPFFRFIALLICLLYEFILYALVIQYVHVYCESVELGKSSAKHFLNPFFLELIRYKFCTHVDRQARRRADRHKYTYAYIHTPET